MFPTWVSFFSHLKQGYQTHNLNHEIAGVYDLTVPFQVNSVVELFYCKLSGLMVNSAKLVSWQVRLWVVFLNETTPLFVVWLAEIGKGRRPAIRVFHYRNSQLPFSSLFFSSYLLFRSWCWSPHPLHFSSSVNWLWSFTSLWFPFVPSLLRFGFLPSLLQFLLPHYDYSSTVGLLCNLSTIANCCSFDIISASWDRLELHLPRS